MTKNKAQFILGLLIAIMPALGFPNSWTYTFIVIMGLAVSIITLLSYWERRGVIKTPKNTITETFAQRAGAITNETPKE
ncbi:MAG: hypothetical protein WC757_01735 [Candidatus Paceibacterota bacterium]|jgi:TRAP-type C4-dicarboxylate transport system permease small subunit